jgi:hypothetical protein
LRFIEELEHSPESSLYRLFEFGEIAKVSEWYGPDNKESIICFDSWEDLKYKIEHTDFQVLRKRIKKRAQKHQEDMVSAWKKVFDDVYIYISFQKTAFFLNIIP